MAPTVTIVLGVECRPQIQIAAQTEAEELRIRDWLQASGYWARLVDLAAEIAEEA
jgi:hypothetical protein